MTNVRGPLHTLQGTLHEALDTSESSEGTSGAQGAVRGARTTPQPTGLFSVRTTDGHGTLQADEIRLAVGGQRQLRGALGVELRHHQVGILLDLHCAWQADGAWRMAGCGWRMASGGKGPDARYIVHSPPGGLAAAKTH